MNKGIYALAGVIVLAQISYAQTPRPVPASYTPTAKVSFIRTWDAMAPEQDPNNLMTRPLRDVRQATQYFDGMNRPIQTVIRQGSMITGAAPVDLVNSVEYDEFGREQFKYLPFPANNTGNNTRISDGLFKYNPFQQQASFMNTQFGGQNETFFYAKTNFEQSVLGRPSDAYAPGNSWVGSESFSEPQRRNVQTKYSVNTITDAVRYWVVTDNSTQGQFGDYATNEAYLPGELYKTIVTDENKKQVVEFKDKEGKVILKKVQLTSNGDDGSGSGYSEWLCTYYVYDYFGRLRAVFQPKAVELLTTNWTPTSDILNELTFRYEYDQRGRMITKQVPGAAPVRMVYDAVDRLILTQDGNMAAQGKWMYTTYDNLNRPVSTGLWPSSLTWAQHAANAVNSTTYPTLSGEEELTKTFYDDYSWLSSNGSPFSDTRSTTDDGQLNTPGSSYPYYQALSQTKFTKGIVTGTKTKVLGTSTYLYGISYYDDKGRLIQAQVQNITTGTDITTTQYNWAGQPMLNILRHQKNGANPQTHIVLSRMTYDDLGRLSKTEKKVNSITGSSNITKDWATIALQEYNALGQLKSKKLGNKPGVSNTPLANLDYEYNIRGWLSSINKAYVTGGTSGDQYFGMQLGYDKDGYGPFATKQFNGNISGTIWRSVGDGMDRKYEFSYDATNRLLKAVFTQLNGSTWDVSTGIDFSMQMGNGSDPTSAYDANGNIKSMLQKGLKINSSPIIDNMTYSYLNGGNSNKLVAVTEDAGIGSMDNKLGDFTDKNTGNDDYSYDVNGNLIMDKNKAIYDASGTVLAPGISYNHLNLPKTILVDTKGSIEYVYDATGSKLKKIVHENNKPDKTTLYVAGFVYESDVLQFFGQEEGRIRYQPVNGSIPADLFKDYFIKDHLGNIRMVLTEQTKEDMYPVATMEVANASVEESFYSNLPNTRYDASSVTHYPPNSPSGNVKVARVGAAQGREKIGPAIILKVMSGDKFNVSVNSWYKTNSGQTPNAPSGLTTTLLNALINGVSNLPGGKITAQELNTAGAFSSGVANFLNGQSGGGNTSRPWAFLNWILFDEQFNLVSSSSGFEQVFAESEYNNGAYPSNNTKLHVRNNMSIDKNGYLYIYVSNETDNIDVYFDNLAVTHIRGRFLEENHYYPFGLPMRCISSSALNFSTSLNNRKYQGYDFNSNFDINHYETFYRLHDPQVGRFWQVDPRPFQDVSPYTAMNNNPIALTDFLGDTTNYYDSQTGELLGTVYGEQGLNDRTISAEDYNSISETFDKRRNELLAKAKQSIKDPKVLKKINEYINTLFNNGMETYINDSRYVETTQLNLNSDIGYIASATFAEMRGGDNNAKSIVAESIINRLSRPLKSAENPDGTILGIINKAYDVSNSKNKAHASFSNPYQFAGKNSAELAAWTSSMSAALKASLGLSNVGQGVIFYNSASSTYFDNNKQLQKIQLDITVNGVKGLWKFKQ